MRVLIPIITLAVVVLFAACKESSGPAAVDVEPTYLNLGGGASYVGVDACQTCHPDKYETYTKSQMGRSWEAATLSNSAADFDHPEPVYDPHNDFYYQPFNRGEELFIKEYRLAGRDTVFKRVEKITYIVGSGQHTNSHIMDINGYLYQMPLTWYVQDGTWDLPPGFSEDNNLRFERPIPLQCITCHNAMPVYVEGAENKYDAVPHGIDCERCHGPGSVHIREMQAGNVVNINTEIDYTIVNPGKLPLDLQFDICEGCHTQGASVFKEDKTFADFRPGLPLTDVENVFWPRYADSIRQFVMASHPDRLQQSQCFLQSHEGSGQDRDYAPMTCITCHDPHLPIETLGTDHYNQTCQSCHSAEQDVLCSEDEAVRAAQADNCVACHMPVSGSVDIPHVRITDHFIRKPDRAASQLLAAEEVEAQKQFIRLASLVEESPTDREVAEGYLVYYEEVTNHPGFLDSAAVYLAKARQETSLQAVADPLVRVLFLQEKYDDIVALAPSLSAPALRDAWTFYRIGEAFLATGQPAEAGRYFEQAVDRAPEHLRFLNKLASAYSQQGRQPEAIALFDAVLQANPKYSEAYNNRGFARILLGDAEGGEADFLAALALNPDIDRALANLASLYYNTNRHAEARPYAKRLLDLDPTNAQYRQLWDLLQ